MTPAALKNRKYQAEYYLKHKAEILEQSKHHYLEHKDEINMRHRTYRKSLHGRAVRLAKKYGCTYSEAEQWLQIKNCQICGNNFAVATDHDHVTGVIRGRLCFRCNRAIGALGDTVELLKKAVTYLEGGPITPETTQTKPGYGGDVQDGDLRVKT